MKNERAVGSNKRHYASFDGLRGFAALSVFVYHLGHWLNAPFLGTNAGLAVDFFFCLSGYVLPAAYQRRSVDVTVIDFMKIRLVRLMPLIVLGIVISVSYVLLRNQVAGPVAPLSSLGLATMLGLLNLPYFGAPHALGGPEIFPLNGPQYTLFLELVVNAVWWTLLRKMRADRLWLWVGLAMISFICLCFTGLGGDLPDTFWSGFPRVFASFFAGVALFHADHRLPAWQGFHAVFWVLIVAMIALFYFPAQASLPTQLVWVALGSPLLVLTGSRVRLPPKLGAVCLLGGALSYPIYCLHYPLFCWLNGLYRARFGAQNIAIEGPAIVVIGVLAGYMLMVFYDEPLRDLLTKHLRSRAASRTASIAR
jgi:peptidoglycan/LPS O-acetylase OafA/YrhL